MPKRGVLNIRFCPQETQQTQQNPSNKINYLITSSLIACLQTSKRPQAIKALTDNILFSSKFICLYLPFATQYYPILIFIILNNLVSSIKLLVPDLSPLVERRSWTLTWSNMHTNNSLWVWVVQTLLYDAGFWVVTSM